MSEHLAVAADAARLAGQYQRDEFGDDPDYEYKSPGDPVSKVDRASDDRITDRLLTAFPDHAVLSEERGLVGDRSSEWTWIVDPLDGTSNFLRGDPDFAVSIALERGDALRAGVVYRPMSDTLYAGARGDGEAVESAATGVSAVDDLAESRVALPFAPDGADRDAVWETHRALGERVEGIRTSGATALDLAALAAGRLDAVVAFDHGRWDCAAGGLLVELAGGQVRDHTDDGGDFLATNGRLQPAVTALTDGRLR